MDKINVFLRLNCPHFLSYLRSRYYFRYLMRNCFRCFWTARNNYCRNYWGQNCRYFYLVWSNCFRNCPEVKNNCFFLGSYCLRVGYKWVCSLNYRDDIRCCNCFAAEFVAEEIDVYLRWEWMLEDWVVGACSHWG